MYITGLKASTVFFLNLYFQACFHNVLYMACLESTTCGQNAFASGELQQGNLKIAYALNLDIFQTMCKCSCHLFCTVGLLKRFRATLEARSGNTAVRFLCKRSPFAVFEVDLYFMTRTVELCKNYELR